MTDPKTIAERLVSAAKAHAADNGDAEFVDGDLELILTAALEFIPVAIAPLFVARLRQMGFAEIPEYEEFFCEKT